MLNSTTHGTHFFFVLCYTVIQLTRPRAESNSDCIKKMGFYSVMVRLHSVATHSERERDFHCNLLVVIQFSQQH